MVGLIHLHAQDRDRVEAPVASTPRQGGPPLERLARRLLFQHFTSWIRWVGGVIWRRDTTARITAGEPSDAVTSVWLLFGGCCRTACAASPPRLRRRSPQAAAAATFEQRFPLVRPCDICCWFQHPDSGRSVWALSPLWQAVQALVSVRDPAISLLNCHRLRFFGGPPRFLRPGCWLLCCCYVERSSSVACGEQAHMNQHTRLRRATRLGVPSRGPACPPRPSERAASHTASQSAVPLRRGRVALARLAGRGPLRHVHAG